MLPSPQAPEQGRSREFTGDAVETAVFDEQPGLGGIGLDPVRREVLFLTVARDSDDESFDSCISVGLIVIGFIVSFAGRSSMVGPLR